MAFAPCGCGTIEKAKHEPDTRLADAQREKGADQQRTWGCPAAGYDGRPELTPAHRLVLGNVQRYTGLPAERCETCPRWYARTPLAMSACRGREWAKNGGIQRATASAALVWAIDLLNDAIRAREAHEAEKIREQTEATKREADARARKHSRR